MFNSTMISNATPKEETYPVLKKSIDPEDGVCIVLFSRPRHGSVVHCNGKCQYEIGHFSNTWFENEFYEIFKGTIELSNF